MFNSIGPWELFLILAVALIVVGPGKLPEVGRSIGKALQEFRKASSGIQQVFNEKIDLDQNLDPEPKRQEEPKNTEIN